MFKTWFKNLCNPTPALSQDTDLQISQLRYNVHFGESEVDRLKIKVSELDERIKHLRSLISVIAKEKKEINVFDFDAQLEALRKAQEAVSHQAMVANQNQAVTDILRATLRDEIARIRFMVFEDVTVDADVAEKQYAKYVDEANSTVYDKGQ